MDNNHIRYYLAIDIGASSGRHILGHVEDGKLILEEMHRFDNRQVRKNGHDCWDLEQLWNGILEGLKACKEAGKIPETVGVDTWGVDYVLLDESDQIISDAVAYRDSRTEGMEQLVGAIIPAKVLYAKTGIQYQTFNTIYQLMAQKEENPLQLSAAKTFLMIPEYIHFRLTGVKRNEYTNATTTNLVNAEGKNWDYSIIEALGFPKEMFGNLSVPGTVLGRFLPEIQREIGFDATVVLPATHDTGSAFLAIPARDNNAVYLSSGTWSLLGVENEHPITTMESLTQNFSNEGGAWYRYRYLKNIMGLWMIQSIRRELNGAAYVQGKTDSEVKDKLPMPVKSGDEGKTWSFPDLISEARKAEDFTSVVDVNKTCFLAPDSMIHAIRKECRNTGQPIPQNVGEIMQCVYRSLALCYKDAIHRLEKLTDKTYTSINIVGGGCQDNYLNELTAKVTGLTVFAGPVEGTAIGNLIVQLIAGGQVSDLAAARAMVRASFPVKEIRP